MYVLNNYEVYVYGEARQINSNNLLAGIRHTKKNQYVKTSS